MDNFTTFDIQQNAFYPSFEYSVKVFLYGFSMLLTSQLVFQGENSTALP